MNVLRNPEFLIGGLLNFIQRERQRHYWTRLMKANVEALRKDVVGGG